MFSPRTYTTPLRTVAIKKELRCGQVADILRVRVLPLARGAGTVDVVAAGLDGRAPDRSVLEQAQAIVVSQRPVGADARVVAPVETALDIEIGRAHV